MAKFGIVVPLYNKAPYVRKALESIINQTYTDWELVVVDDGSRDESCNIARQCIDASCNTNCKLIQQPNAGVATARNNGVAKLSSEYVCFLDADDWWAPTFLEEMDKFIKDYPDAGLWASNYWYVRNEEERIGVAFVYDEFENKHNEEFWCGIINYPKSYYSSGNMPVWTGATIIRRSIYDETDGFPLGINLGEDFLLWSKIALKYNVAFFNKSLAYYNNDVITSLRLTRHLHKPETHMLWHMQHIPETGEWKVLTDWLRINGLLEYWLDKQLHKTAAIEVRKVDWNVQPQSIQRLYKMPICVLRLKMFVMTIGSKVKQWIKA